MACGCYVYLKNPVDAEDAVQSVFLKLIQQQIVFNDYEYEKAWLTVTTRKYGSLINILVTFYFF